MPTERGKVQIKPGAIAPVTRGLWHAAAEKLDEAARGISEMEAATDRIQFEAGWTRFIDSLQEFWTRFFDEGKTNFPAFHGWAGNVTQRINSDSLLKYLVIARHQSQHGRLSLGWAEGAIQIGGDDFFGTVGDVKIWSDGSFEADVNLTPGSKTPFRPTFAPGAPFLPVIVNRPPGRAEERYDPPTMHLDRQLSDSSPVAVARLGWEFYRGVLAAALAKFAVKGNREEA